MEATAACSVWLIAGMIAASISAAAAAAAATFSLLALRSEARAVDVSSYLEILKRLQEFERRLDAAASTAHEGDFALREYVNFLEGVAHLYQTKRFGSGTAMLCRDALCNSIAAFEINHEVMGVLRESITSLQTFEHLEQFEKTNKVEIEEKKAIFRELAAHVS